METAANHVYQSEEGNTTTGLQGRTGLTAWQGEPDHHAHLLSMLNSRDHQRSLVSGSDLGTGVLGDSRYIYTEELDSL